MVAEGVETEAQRDFLQRCGCDLLQDYLLSRPQPEEPYTQLLRRGRTLPEAPAADRLPASQPGTGDNPALIA